MKTSTIENETAELDPQLGSGDGHSENEGGDDGDESPPGVYVTLFKNGHVTNHEDYRSESELHFDLKMALMFPFTPASAFTEAEFLEFERAKRLDPKRFQRKDAKLHLFAIGKLSADDDDVDSIDPREVQAIVAMENFGPPMGDDEEEDFFADDGSGDRVKDVPRPHLDRFNGSGPEALRRQLGGQ